MIKFSFVASFILALFLTTNIAHAQTQTANSSASEISQMLNLGKLYVDAKATCALASVTVINGFSAELVPVIGFKTQKNYEKYFGKESFRKAMNQNSVWSFQDGEKDPLLNTFGGAADVILAGFSLIVEPFAEMLSNYGDDKEIFKDAFSFGTAKWMLKGSFQQTKALADLVLKAKSSPCQQKWSSFFLELAERGKQQQKLAIQAKTVAAPNKTTSSDVQSQKALASQPVTQAPVASVTVKKGEISSNQL